jgi:hypothetical protein
MMEEPHRYCSQTTALVIAIAVVLFVALRLPMVLFSSGQMDEQWFAVPGYTVWKEGIPRIPYCPTRKRENFFENADRCLFALPPALHYVQAPFFGIFPAGYSAARLPSFFGGIIGLVVLGLLTRKIFHDTFIWGMGLILIAMSRPMMFTAITARPDLLCSVCCWSAIACMWLWADRDSVERTGVGGELIAAGTLCGLGLLFHPFALVGCLQCGLWAICRRGGWKLRMLRGLAIAVPAALVLSLWLPLILRFPKEFESQFTSNVLERSGPGLMQRLLWPWASLWHHARYQWEYHQAIQFVFLSAGGVLGLISLGLGKDSTPIVAKYRYRIAILVVSSIYLTATIAGIHPTKGYWVYTIGWLYPLAVMGSVVASSIALRWLIPALRGGMPPDLSTPCSRNYRRMLDASWMSISSLMYGSAVARHSCASLASGSGGTLIQSSIISSSVAKGSIWTRRRITMPDFGAPLGIHRRPRIAMSRSTLRRRDAFWIQNLREKHGEAVDCHSRVQRAGEYRSLPGRIDRGLGQR